MKFLLFSIILFISIYANAQTEKYRTNYNKAVTRKDIIKIDNNSKEYQYALIEVINKNFSKKIILPSCEITDTFNVLINGVLIANIKVQLSNDTLFIETTPTEIINGSSIFITKNNFYRLNTRFIDAFRDFDNTYVVNTINKIKSIKTDSLLIINNSIMHNNKNSYDELSIKIENMNNNMRLCHNNYRSGTICIVVGTLMNLTSSFILMETSNSYNSTTDNTVPILIGVAGIVLSSVGTIIQIDSHKYLGKGYKE